MRNPRLIRMAFYEASDGPRVMLFGPQEADFEFLQQCFDELGEVSETRSTDLDQFPWVHPAGGIKLRLISLESNLESLKLIAPPGIRKTDDYPPAFEWRQTSNEWKHTAELTQGFLSSNSPCHQYLTIYPIEEATVVLSKGEYADEVLNP
jgi:hypothetical protein